MTRIGTPRPLNEREPEEVPVTSEAFVFNDLRTTRHNDEPLGAARRGANGGVVDSGGGMPAVIPSALVVSRHGSESS